MATNFAKEILSSRNRFIEHLKEDLIKTEEIISATAAELDKLKITAENVQDLGRKVEHQSLIPLAKNIYVNGTITHTGEYFLDKLAFPESYTVVETLDNTIKMLESRIKMQSEMFRKGEDTKGQICERIKLLQETAEDQEEDSINLPKEIVSDKGVAVKVGEFYEILEFEN